MNNDDTPREIVFAPGAFDEFDGTQEELDDVVAEIKSMFASGDFLANSEPVDLNELASTDPEMYAKLVSSLIDPDDKRTLQ